MALLIFSFAAGAGAVSAATSRVVQVKPSDFKVENPQNSTEAKFSWKNPWGPDYFGNKITTEYGCWGMKIDKSEDGKKTWQNCVTIANYDAGSSYYGKTTAYAKLEHGKTYYFRAYYYDSSKAEGPMVTIGPIKWSTESGEKADIDAAKKADIIAKINNKGKVTNSGGYGATNPIKAGMKRVFKRGAYTLTVSVKNAMCVNSYGDSVTTATISLKCESHLDDTLLYPSLSGVKDPNGKSITIFWDKSRNTVTGEYTVQYKNDFKCQRHEYVIRYPYNSPDIPDYSKEYFEFATVPAPVVLSLGASGITTTKNTISLKNLPSNCKKIISYRKKGTSKWSTKSTTGTSTSLTGLKANTVYQLRYRCQVTVTSSSGKKKTITSAYTGIMKVSTQVATAPVVASVSTSGAKYVNKWVPGKWVNTNQGQRWEPGHQDNYTGFTVTVKMKKPSNVYGFVVKGYGVPTKGATLKFAASKGGNSKGKTFTFQIASYTNSTPDAGMSPYRKVTVTIK